MQNFTSNQQKINGNLQSSIGTLVQLSINKTFQFIRIDNIPMLSKNSSFQLFVRLPNGNGTSLIVDSQLTWLDLTKLLSTCSVQLPDTYRLIFQGSSIKNYNLRLAECGVKNGSIIHIHPQDENRHKRMKVNVAFLFNGDKFFVNHSTTETIWSLKIAISTLTRINPKEQVLVFLGKRLKNNRTLLQYKISSDSLISLIIQPIEAYSESRDPQTLNQVDLATSLCSFGDRKTGITMSTMFRSDSLNRRNIEEIAPYEVVIQEKRFEEQSSIKFSELFNSCRGDTLKQSLTFDSNLFESAKLLNLQPRIEIESQEQFALPNLNLLIDSVRE